jgi:hypothetical protein
MGIAQHNPIALVLLAAPFAIFTIYVTWLIVPAIVEIVVPEVVRAVIGA